MSDSIGSNYRPCDNAPECPNEGTKWLGMGTFDRECLCVPCYEARRRGQRKAPAVDPIAETERRRLAKDTAAVMRRAEEQSRAEVVENERREEAARRSRHATRIGTAAPIVHPAPPVAPQVPRPAPVAATVAPAAPASPVEAVGRLDTVATFRPPSNAERVLEWLKNGNSGATKAAIRAALGLSRYHLKHASAELLKNGHIAAIDRHNAAHIDRMFLPGTLPGYPEIPAEQRCSVDGCHVRKRARGMCNAHWLKWRKANPTGTLTVA